MPALIEQLATLACPGSLMSALGSDADPRLGAGRSAAGPRVNVVCACRRAPPALAHVHVPRAAARAARVGSCDCDAGVGSRQRLVTRVVGPTVGNLREQIRGHRWRGAQDVGSRTPRAVQPKAAGFAHPSSRRARWAISARGRRESRALRRALPSTARARKLRARGTTL